MKYQDLFIGQEPLSALHALPLPPSNASLLCSLSLNTRTAHSLLPHTRTFGCRCSISLEFFSKEKCR